MKSLLGLVFFICISIVAQAQNLPEFNDKPAYLDPKTKELKELEKSQYNTMAKAKGIFKAEGGFSLNGISSLVKLPKQDELKFIVKIGYSVNADPHSGHTDPSWLRV